MQPGVIQNGHVVGLARMGLATMEAVIVGGDAVRGPISSFVNSNEPSAPMLETVRLLAPLPAPPRLSASG